MVRMFNNWETDIAIYCFKPSIVHWFNRNFNANWYVNILTVKLITIYPHLKDGPHSNIKFINFFESGKNRALELILIISSKLYTPSNHKFPLIKIKYWKKLLDNKIKISNNSNKSTWLNIFPKKKKRSLCSQNSFVLVISSRCAI